MSKTRIKDFESYVTDELIKLVNKDDKRKIVFEHRKKVIKKLLSDNDTKGDDTNNG